MPPEQLERARHLRRDATVPERLLWSRLRDGQLAGLKFRRQHTIGPFIADFYCHEFQLVIELDGDSHIGRARYDNSRTAYFHDAGIRLLRIANDDVIADIDEVLEAILRACRR
jgi:very-short-patch-repair endonuclease